MPVIARHDRLELQHDRTQLYPYTFVCRRPGHPAPHYARQYLTLDEATADAGKHVAQEHTEPC